MRRSSVSAWVLVAASVGLLAFAFVLAGSTARWWEVVLCVVVVLSPAAIGLLVVVRWGHPVGWLLLASALMPATGLLSSASMLAGSRGSRAHARCDLGGACGP